MALTDIVVNNPYRVLGVVANATTKDIVAQTNRLTAFARVGRAMPEEMDLAAILPTVARSTETIATARHQLVGERDRVRYGLFWFVKVTGLDTLSLKHLVAGDIDKAREVWQQDDNTSSLHNRAVLALIQSDTSKAMTLAARVVHDHGHRANLLMAIGGKDCLMSEKELSHLLIDTYIEQNGSAGVTFNQLNHSQVSQNDLDYVLQKMGADQERDIDHLLDMARKVVDHAAADQLAMGRQLIEQTARPLRNLVALHGETSTYFTTLADNVANAIEQCAIKYYNNSADNDSASNALTLERHALAIAQSPSMRQQIEQHIDQLYQQSHHATTEERLQQVGQDIAQMSNRQMEAQEVIDIVRKNVNLLADADSNIATAIKQLAEVALGQLIEWFNQRQKQCVDIDEWQTFTTCAIEGLQELGRLPVDERTTSRLTTTTSTLVRVLKQAQWVQSLTTFTNTL